MNRTKKVLKIVVNVILWLFVAFAVLVTILVFAAQGDKNGLPSIGGKTLITVLTDSMKPTFKSGDLIIDKVLTTEEQRSCQVGDVITFYADLNSDGNDEINTHRIIEVYEDAGYTYYITQGDNTEMSKVPDSPIVSSKVLGKYTGTRLAFVGSVISFLQTSTGFLCCIVLPLIVFFLFELYRFIITIMRVKGKKKLSAEDEEEIKKRAIEEYLRQQEQNGGENTPEQSPKADE